MNLQIPDQLPDAVAVALCDTLAALLDQLWKQYEQPLLRAAMAELHKEADDHRQADLFDDEISF